MCVQFESLENTVGKGEILLITSNFSYSQNVFYVSGELSPIFIKFEIVNFKLFQFWMSQICRLG